jgi:probable phosphoglycerate mutase
VDKKERIGRIYSSPLSRAYQTAEAINQHIGAEIIARDDLKEIFLGQWEGKTVGEIIDMDAVAFKQWEEEDNPALGFGIETYFVLRERAAKALNEMIATEGTEKDLIVVSHGAWIKVAVLSVLEIPLYNRMKLIIDNVSLTTLDYSKENGFRLLSLNDSSHVPEDQKGFFPGVKR